MSGIRRWLEGLGLGQYAQAFEANDIDLDLLPQVDDQALKDIGVASTGHRLRLRAAIAALTPATSPTPVNTDTSAARQLGAPSAERRQLTVMFCDLVGSTELSHKLDPEALRDLMRGYQQACSGVIERYDGHVAQYLGDGLMVYFGWPRAHEDDAERAVRASLEIVQAVKQVAAADALRVRIGIATGPVVVGETGAGDASVPKVAVGETPNLAARLQGLAQADQIVIGASTRRLLGAAFEYQDLGEHVLKGVVEPVRVWQVSGERQVEMRFDARGANLAPMVGREIEYAAVLRAWEQAKTGNGQMVLLSGEPGIGKSRLLRALRERLGSEGVAAWQYQCSPYLVNSPLYPIIDHLERALKFTRVDTADQRLDKLEALLARFNRPVQEANLIARLLNLPADSRYGAMMLGAQMQKDETIRALHSLIASAAEQAPLLLLFEDLHWADPTTLESIDALLKRLPDMPVLVMATHRPEFRAAWVGRAGVTALSLSRLDAQRTEAIATRVAGMPLPKEVLEQIVGKTDGVPLFVEELTKAVLESGVLGQRDGRYELTSALPSVQIPSTLQDSLLARLDRLAPVKELAQIAACIGREFDYELLAAIVPEREKDLSSALDQLVGTQLLQARGRPPAATYVFTHALVQDAAYSTLLRSRRAQLHAAIARAILARNQDRPGYRPEIPAYHYTQAGLPAEAVPLWFAAGKASFQRSAVSEAVSQLRTGLEQLTLLPPTPERDTAEIDFQALLGAALIQFRGLASPEARQAFERARRLCQALGRTEHVFHIVWGMFVNELIGGRPKLALSLATELSAMATGDVALEVVAQTALMDAEFWVGNLETARELARVALARGRDDEALAQLAAYSFDMKSINLVYASHIEWMLGYPDRARQRKSELDAWVHRLNNPFMHAFARTWGASIFHYTGELQLHREQLEHGWKVSKEIGFPHFEKQAEIWVAWSRIVHGDHSAANFALLEQGIDQYVSTGSGIAVPYWYGLYAQALGCRGSFDEALAAIAKARDLAESTGDSAHLAELHRLTGDLHLLRDKHSASQAEAAFQESLRIARSQKAKGWELRAATSYAELLDRQGRTGEARDLLHPVYGWFTEGFDSRDLQQAKALLQRLAH